MLTGQLTYHCDGLLNNIKARYPGNRIIALDFGRGVAVVQLPSGETRAVNFDTTTLAVKS